MIKKIKEIFFKIKKRLFGKLCECMPKKKSKRGRPKKKWVVIQKIYLSKKF